MAKSSLASFKRHQRRRKRRRLPLPRRPGPREPPEAVSAEGPEDAWRDFAASFVAAGLVAPPPPDEEPEPPGESLAAAAEAHEGRAALLCLRGQTLTFTGKCCLTCLYGSVEVLGFTITPDQPPYHLFSPHTHCALTMKAIAYKEPEKPEKEMKREARSILRAHHVPQDARRKLMKKFAPQCSIVLLEHLDTPVTRFLLSHPSFSHMFRAKKEKVPCFSLEDEALASVGVGRLALENGLLVSGSMLLAIEELLQACQEEDEGCPVILVCGPKSVGKSTFNRYLINLLLNRLPCVEYLECDLGQPEFTPPGCISLINVTEPLLGPPYTHQRRPHKMMYFGETSCEQDTERYIDTVKAVFTAYERDVPLVVNTMGWVKGTGLLLLIDIIRLLSPSHVVQISAEDFKDVPQLTLEYVCGAAGLHTRRKGPSTAKRLKSEAEDVGQCWSHRDFRLPPSAHKLLCVQPQFPGAGLAGSVRTHSSTLRDLAVLGYLGLLQPSDSESVLPLHGLVPYQVPFGAVALKVLHVDVAPAHILYALNASWVGLCQVQEELPSQAEGPVLLTQTPICDCLGFGIVRGVDMDKKLYYILSPVAPESLRLVNCLLVGNISIPNSVFLNQVGIEGEVPYVTSEYNFDISGAGKLKMKKHLKRREHSQS
ncbi:polynucleotide 5'-hydroxyl-kinase NOL9 [Pogona vitticeps]